MSHFFTIQTTTATTRGSTITTNTAYVETCPWILKSLQVVLGIICVGIVGFAHSTLGVLFGGAFACDDIHRIWIFTTPYTLFFFLTTTTFMIASFIHLVSCLASSLTSSILSKSFYIQELIYHGTGCVLLVLASISNLVDSIYYNTTMNIGGIIAAVLGLVNAVMYCASAILALDSYRGI